MKRFLQLTVIIMLTASIASILTLYFTDTSGVPSTFEVHNIQSTILSEQREIIVKLPVGYQRNNEKRYPVVYVVGGNSLTYSIAYDASLLHRTQHIQEAIIVGVSNISQDTRQRYLTPPYMRQNLDKEDASLGKADQYLDFLETEVIAMIDQKYRTGENRIVIGHSREGLFVLYALTAQPTLFQGHIALSPALWREDNLFVRHFERYLNQTDTIHSRLFLSMGEQEVEKMTNAYDLLVDMLSQDKYDSKLQWTSMYTENATHRNNAQLSAPIGLNKLLTPR